ncbi:MAG TPA: SAM-dependent methyltransferase [Saprospiraceae bacterium]|nr:SAM-dependent methyltransferase [Saprospiraceae bacterium]HMQ83851.1 SAM-dependent methyltransferase [Saprospiraceae bacterium]
MDRLTASYWNEKYHTQETPWDIGYASPPIRHYFEQVKDKNTRMLIPGAGKAHEAIYLHRLGFREVWVCDWAADAFAHLKQEAPDFPEHHLLVMDFFSIDLTFDLIVEQTFFCAIDPSLRSKYVQKVHELLAPEGRLIGLLFASPFGFEGPPFGGTKEEYQQLFHPYFDLLQLKTADNSIQPRLGNELFMEFKKKGFDKSQGEGKPNQRVTPLI